MDKQCTACGCKMGYYGLVLMIDPAKPKGARQKDYIVGYHCDNSQCEKEAWLIFNGLGVRDPSRRI